MADQPKLVAIESLALFARAKALLDLLDGKPDSVLADSNTTEESESTETSESSEDSEGSEGSENKEGKDGTEDSEGSEDSESSEASENSEATENSEDTENSESTENSEGLIDALGAPVSTPLPPWVETRTDFGPIVRRIDDRLSILKKR